MRETRFFVFLLLFLFALLPFIALADANPFMWYNTVEPDPATTPPALVLLSPQNYTCYPLGDNVTVSFSAIKPQLDNANTSLTGISYSVDKHAPTSAYYLYDQDTRGVPEFNGTFTLSNLSVGDHKLTVAAKSVVLPGNMSVFELTTYSTIYFTVAPPQSENVSVDWLSVLLFSVVLGAVAATAFGVIHHFRAQKN
jgi:hypothetical protein